MYEFISIQKRKLKRGAGWLGAMGMMVGQHLFPGTDARGMRLS
jgi:hypothetical protein